MDSRLKDLAGKLDAGLIARREFLRNAAVITGGTAAGLQALKGMAGAQSATKLRVWLFKSFVTAGNDVLEKQVQNWAKERKVTVEVDWATFGDREQKFVAAIEAGNPPDIAEMNINGPMRYKPALQDVSKVAGDIASARGGMLSFADKSMKVDGKFYGVPRYSMTGVFYIRKDIMEAKGLKPPTVYDPGVVEFAQKTQDVSKGLYGFGQTLNRSDDGDGFMQAILWNYGGGTWDKDGKPALATTFHDQNLKALQFSVDTITKHKIQPPGVMGWTDVSNNEAFMAGKLVTTNNGASLYYAMVAEESRAGVKDPARSHSGRTVGQLRRRLLLQLGHLPEEQVRRSLRRHDPLHGGRGALRRVRQGLRRSGRARLQEAHRGRLLEVRPELQCHHAEHHSQRARGLAGSDHTRRGRDQRPAHPLPTWRGAW